MSRFSALLWLLFSQVSWAHHTKDHMMLTEDVEQVITATREGSQGGWVLLVWAVVIVMLLLGFVRWWNSRT